jgi:hypothetical protein
MRAILMPPIEMRWRIIREERVLQYRFQNDRGEWSDWINVPEVFK